MALLLADNLAKAVEQELIPFQSLRPPAPAAWPCWREQAVCQQEHSSSKVAEV